MTSKNSGHVKRVPDSDISSSVIEIDSEKLAETHISCPLNASDNLGITLPYIILVVKNMKKYFSFEIQIQDDKNITRRFRSSNYQSSESENLQICSSLVELLRIYLPALESIARTNFIQLISQLLRDYEPILIKYESFLCSALQVLFQLNGSENISVSSGNLVLKNIKDIQEKF